MQGFAHFADKQVARWVDRLPSDEQEYFEERAAVYEYCARLRRAEAERMAWEAVLARKNAFSTFV